MKKQLITIFCLLLPLFLFAMQPVKWNQRYQTYIDTYCDIAVCEMLQHGIPASITLAQGLLESAAGESDLCRKGNNHFGIKAHEWKGPTMQHDDDRLGEHFRVYNSAYESFEDHSQFLKRQRYSRLFTLKRTDYAGWARGLKQCGYATNPKYAQLLIDIIQCYHLDSYDLRTTYDEAKVRGTSRPGYAVAYSSVTHRNLSKPVSAHEVMMNNKNYYVIARPGDTFRTIAAEFDMSYRKVARVNERDKNDELVPGEIIYLEKKQTKADKMCKGYTYIARPGDSMYSIAQQYGIRLKSLYKKNKLSPDYQLKVGDNIKLR